VTKEALMGMDVSDDILSKASYCVDYAYADYYLSMGHNVILDSTCHSEWQLKKSIEVANRNKANYKYIECSLDDRDVIYRRLNTREYGKSQIDSLDNNDLSDWYESIKRPEGYYLRIDTSAPVKAYINTVMIYLEQKD
jgi:predicted kinase